MTMSNGPREGETLGEWKARRRRELLSAAGVEVPSPRVETRPKIPTEQKPWTPIDPPVDWDDDPPEVA